MDDIELPPQNAAEWLAAARRDFPDFYARAGGDDAALLDHLVVAHASLVMLTNVPRVHLPHHKRVAFERVTNDTEQLFAAFREQVATCATYRALSIGERVAIERVLFDVKPPIMG